MALTTWSKLKRTLNDPRSSSVLRRWSPPFPPPAEPHGGPTAARDPSCAWRCLMQIPRSRPGVASARSSIAPQHGPAHAKRRPGATKPPVLVSLDRKRHTGPPRASGGVRPVDSEDNAPLPLQLRDQNKRCPLSDHRWTLQVSESPALRTAYRPPLVGSGGAAGSLGGEDRSEPRRVRARREPRTRAPLLPEPGAGPDTTGYGSWHTCADSERCCLLGLARASLPFRPAMT